MFWEVNFILTVSLVSSRYFLWAVNCASVCRQLRERKLRWDLESLRAFSWPATVRPSSVRERGSSQPFSLPHHKWDVLSSCHQSGHHWLGSTMISPGCCLSDILNIIQTCQYHPHLSFHFKLNLLSTINKSTNSSGPLRDSIVMVGALFDVLRTAQCLSGR